MEYNQTLERWRGLGLGGATGRGKWELSILWRNVFRCSRRFRACSYLERESWFRAELFQIKIFSLTDTKIEPSTVVNGKQWGKACMVLKSKYFALSLTSWWRHRSSSWMSLTRGCWPALSGWWCESTSFPFDTALYWRGGWVLLRASAPREAGRPGATLFHHSTVGAGATKTGGNGNMTVFWMEWKRERYGWKEGGRKRKRRRMWFLKGVR